MILAPSVKLPPRHHRCGGRSVERSVHVQKPAAFPCRGSNLGGVGISARQEYCPEDPPLPTGRSHIREPWLEHDGELTSHFHQLEIIEPHSGEPVAHSIAQRVHMSAR